MIIYDNNFIVKNLVSLFNDALIKYDNKVYLYACNDIESKLGEPSKSYLEAQFYVDEENRLYLSYLLDPNTIWGTPDKSVYLYKNINKYILSEVKKGLIKDLHIEFLFSQDAFTESHEIKSFCRTEETNRKLYNDTIGIWKSLNGSYKFIRDNSILIKNKNKVYMETGKNNFSDYRNEVNEINSRYNFLTDNNSLLDAFEEYKVVYNNYFGRELKVIEESDINKFFMIDWTDYSIFGKLYKE